MACLTSGFVVVPHSSPSEPSVFSFRTVFIMTSFSRSLPLSVCVFVLLPASYWLAGLQCHVSLALSVCLVITSFNFFRCVRFSGRHVTFTSHQDYTYTETKICTHTRLHTHTVDAVYG